VYVKRFVLSVFRDPRFFGSSRRCTAPHIPLWRGIVKTGCPPVILLAAVCSKIFWRERRAVDPACRAGFMAEARLSKAPEVPPGRRDLLPENLAAHLWPWGLAMRCENGYSMGKFPLQRGGSRERQTPSEESGYDPAATVTPPNTIERRVSVRYLLPRNLPP